MILKRHIVVKLPPVLVSNSLCLKERVAFRRWNECLRAHLADELEQRCGFFQTCDHTPLGLFFRIPFFGIPFVSVAIPTSTNARARTRAHSAWRNLYHSAAWFWSHHLYLLFSFPNQISRPNALTPNATTDGAIRKNAKKK